MKLPLKDHRSALRKKAAENRRAFIHFINLIRTIYLRGGVGWEQTRAVLEYVFARCDIQPEPMSVGKVIFFPTNPEKIAGGRK